MNVMRSSKVINNVLLVPYNGILNIDALGATRVIALDLSKDCIYKDYSNNPTLESIIRFPEKAPINGAPVFNITSSIRSKSGFIGFIAFPINVTKLMNSTIYPSLTDEDVQVLLVDKDGIIFGSRDEAFIYNENYYLTTIEPDFFNEMTRLQENVIETDFMGIDAMVAFVYYAPIDSYIIAIKDVSERKKAQFSNIQGSLLLYLSIWRR